MQVSQSSDIRASKSISLIMIWILRLRNHLGRELVHLSGHHSSVFDLLDKLSLSSLLFFPFFCYFSHTLVFLLHLLKLNFCFLRAHLSQLFGRSCVSFRIHVEASLFEKRIYSSCPLLLLDRQIEF